MKIYKKLILIPLLFAAILMFADKTRAQTQVPTTSNGGSKTVSVSQKTIDGCQNALDELELAEKLIQSQDTEIKLLRERLESEKEKSSLLLELADTRKREADALRLADSSNKETIALKNKIIENKDREIEILKKKKPSVLTIVKTIGIGIGIGLILK